MSILDHTTPADTAQSTTLATGRGFNTVAVHAGQDPDPLTGAVVPPIYQTSTFVQDGINVLRGGHEYSRGSNPTRNGFETQLAALEHGVQAFAFASGLAAEDALLRSVLRPGDHIVLGGDGYGGTNRLINSVLGGWGVQNTAVDITDPAAVADAVRPGSTAVLWVETPSNPLLGIADLAAWAEIAHRAGALLVVDNTFASPYLQQPLDLGADAVVHSTTKYIGGHSDVLGGAVVVADREFRGQPLAEAVGYQQFAAGAVAGPQDTYLAARGLKTLGLRMDRHCANAAELAGWLQGHPQIAQVYYPGLPDHPGHELAARQMDGYGGIVSVRLAGGEAAARAFAQSTELFALSVSLGGVESLICYCSEMTHASVRGTALAVPTDLVRLSVGVEDVADLRADIEAALDCVQRLESTSFNQPAYQKSAHAAPGRAGHEQQRRALETKANDLEFAISTTRFDEEYSPSSSSRGTTNFANLARGENRQQNLRNTLTMIDRRVNDLAHWDNPGRDRYAVEIEIVSVDLHFAAEADDAVFPVIEMLDVQILDTLSNVRIDGIVGNNFSSYVRDYDFSVVLPEHHARESRLSVPADFGDLHGKLFKHFLDSTAYQERFAQPPVICISVSSTKTYRRLENRHPILGVEYRQDESSLTDRYFEKMGLRVRYFMPRGAVAPLAFYHRGDLLNDHSSLSLIGLISTMETFQKIYRPEIYNAHSTAGRTYRPNLENRDYSLTPITYDREERNQLARTQGKFTQEHLVKPHWTVLEQWAATASPLARRDTENHR
ncbi:hypothetical protein GCM10025784_04930 [Citricoccus nitrophenolicus]